MSSETKKLSPKQEAFCQSYALHANASRAAREAGYSTRTAGSQGHDLLKKPEIEARISSLRTERLKALHMGPEETLAEIAKIARANMGEVLHVTPDGDPYVDLNKATPEFLAAVAKAEIEDFTDGREVDDEGNVIKRDVRRVKVTMHSKLGALQTIAKHHGLLTDKVEVTVSEDFADTMIRARERARKAREGRDGS